MLFNHDSHSGQRSGTTSCHKRLQKESRTLFSLLKDPRVYRQILFFLLVIIIFQSFYCPLFFSSYSFFFIIGQFSFFYQSSVFRVGSNSQRPTFQFLYFDLQGRWRGGRGCSRRCHGESSLRSRDLLTNLTFLPPNQPCAKLRRTEARLKSSHCC